MAKSALKNPRVYSGVPLEKSTVRALDGQTWKQGQPGWYDSGYARPMATDDTTFEFFFAANQDTAASSSDVVIETVPDGTRFVGYISSDDVDTVAAQAHVGGDYGIHVGSNVATVNVNETATAVVHVDALLYQKEPYKNASTDSPGQVIFHIKAAARDA